MEMIMDAVGLLSFSYSAAAAVMEMDSASSEALHVVTTDVVLSSGLSLSFPAAAVMATAFSKPSCRTIPAVIANQIA